jgi:dolichol-phosphate mannosyltransferase
LELHFQLVENLSKITNNFEIIFINDASPDGAWETITEISKKDKRVKGINFSRNFGQHFAITAGLQHSTGNWIIVMDCDLQDQPDEIEKLYGKAMEGYDIVLASRTFRQDNYIKKMFSGLFYITLSYLTDTQQNPEVANFGIYHRKVIDSILLMGDSIRYFPTMVNWVGFRSVEIPVLHGKRFQGVTSYSFRRAFRLAIDVMFAFSDKPLRLTVKLGLTVSLLSVVFAIYNFILYLKGEIDVPGWASMIISIWFLSGLIIFVLGIVGLYIGKTFEKVKERPLFIIRESVNFNDITE